MWDIKQIITLKYQAMRRTISKLIVRPITWFCGDYLLINFVDISNLQYKTSVVCVHESEASYRINVHPDRCTIEKFLFWRRKNSLFVSRPFSRSAAWTISSWPLWWRMARTSQWERDSSCAWLEHCSGTARWVTRVMHQSPWALYVALFNWSLWQIN